ncbi:MAG: cytidylate kinase-like family protein [Verrucomicrobiota bacterium]|nr:cytidylate kinase-like family protein [Verrucomicrobiota bacterium]
MWKNINLERCFSYINCQLASGVSKQPAIKPAVTISRMCGSGGRTVASRLVEYLKDYTPLESQWTVFDRKLIEKVLEDHHLSKRIAELLPEDHKSLLSDTLEELLGLHPPISDIVKQTAETIWNLAEMGYVILVGRGANIITQKLPNVFHVRLVGSLDKRVERVQEAYEMNRLEAREFIQKQETGKRRYLKEHFGKDIDNPLLYHLILNTDLISYEDSARLIARTVIHRFQLEPCGTTLAV